MRRVFRCFGIVAMLTVLGVPVPSSTASEQDSCYNVTSINIENMKIEIPYRGMVQMDNGVGFSSDAGPGGESHDWKITLVQDEILQPSPSALLRLVRFSAEHVTGSGAWDHVFVYECRNGKLIRLFVERYHYGVKIRRLSDDELLFISDYWMKSDPMCCPSQEKRAVFKWDPEGMKYFLAEDSIRPKTVIPK